MNRTIVAVVLGAALVLSGCGPSYTEGTVVSKSIDQGSCKRKDGKTKCSSAEYELGIRRSDGVIVEIDVSKRTFDRANIGEYGSWE